MSYEPRIIQYTKNCSEVDSPEYTGIEGLFMARGVYVVMGAAERHGSSRYIAQWIFGPDGTLCATRRKLKPTAVERVLHNHTHGRELTTGCCTERETVRPQSA